MSTAIQLRVDDTDIAALEEVVAECNLQVLSSYGQFRQAFQMAAGMRRISELITNEMMQDVMELQNTRLGFRTDKTNGGYPVDVVKRCLIEATLRGVRPVGNEFNIIAGQCYVTKEGFERLLKEYPGLTDLRIDPTVPVMKNGGAVISYKASWTLHGEPDSMERDIPVKVNQGMGVDAILGKGARKIRAAIYGQITGAGDTIPEGEVEEGAEVMKASTKKALPSPLNDELAAHENGAKSPAQMEEPPADLFDKGSAPAE